MDFSAFPGGLTSRRSGGKAEDAIERAPGELAISDVELKTVRRHLHKQIAAEIRAFEQERPREEKAVTEREQRLAERRRQIESLHADRLLRNRQQLPQIDWTNPPDFEAEAARKAHEQILAELDRQFSPETFFDRLVPHLVMFGRLVAIFERIVVPNLSPSEKPAHSKRIENAIVDMIVPLASVRSPLPPTIVSPYPYRKTAWTEIAKPLEPPEPQGELGHLPLGDFWRLVYALKQPRRLVHPIERAKRTLRPLERAKRILRLALRAQLRADFVQIVEDRRSRREMVGDCLEMHGTHEISHKHIAEAAKVSMGDFYKWRDDNPRIGPQKHRRLLFVVCCPVWPPPPI